MSAEDAIAVLRIKRIVGGFECRLTYHDVSSEPLAYVRRTPDARVDSTDVGICKKDEPYEEQPVLFVDGLPVVSFRHSKYGVRLFSPSRVFVDKRSAIDAAFCLEEQIGSVEYRLQQICLDATWDEIEKPGKRELIASPIG